MTQNLNVKNSKKNLKLGLQPFKNKFSNLLKSKT